MGKSFNQALAGKAEFCKPFQNLINAMCNHAGKENMFVFGVDAEDVPRLREERKDFKDYDPRWVKVMDSLLAGQVW